MSTPHLRQETDEDRLIVVPMAGMLQGKNSEAMPYGLYPMELMASGNKDPERS